jgi:tRNA pseudouridine55 synthase
MWDLKRVSTGNFHISDSIDLENLNAENISRYIVPVDDALEQYPQLVIEDAYMKNILNGIPIRNKIFLNNVLQDKLYRVYIDKNKFIGLGMRKSFEFKMVKMFIRGN